MGAWGYKLYDSDCASDIRDSFLSLVKSGLSFNEIRKRITFDYAEVFADAEEGPIAELAMADLLWENGALNKQERENAVKFIMNGGDVTRWREESSELASNRAAELDLLKDKLLSPMPRKKEHLKSRTKSLHWHVGEVYALPLSEIEGAEMLSLSDEFILLYINDEAEEIKGYRIPKVWAKITTGGKLPMSSTEFNSLDYIQISCTKMADRFQPFSRYEDLPDDFKQEYHPDEWGYLREFTMVIYESKGNHPPASMIYVGSFPDAEPPANNYIRYRSGLGAAWKYVGEYLIQRYRLHNLHQAQIYSLI